MAACRPSAAGCTVLTLLCLAGGCASGDHDGSRRAAATARAAGFLVRTNYHGWSDAILLSNGQVEAIIVPSIGRVMQFRFTGAQDGPFWENEALRGQAPDPASTEWQNFGGDKVWPAPQAAWGDVTGRKWPAPAAFDTGPVETRIEGYKVTLTGPVDPGYGIRTRRDIRLALDAPVLHITTTFEKVAGEPMLVSLWTVTQLQDPVLVCAPVARPSIYREGFKLLSREAAPGMRVENGLLQLTRDPKTAHKVGLDAVTLLWVGADTMLRMDSARLPGRDYPDDGASAEIYTNEDPLPYVELEMLGPLEKVTVGTTVQRTTTYTLLRRTEPDPEIEIRKQLRR